MRAGTVPSPAVAADRPAGAGRSGAARPAVPHVAVVDRELGEPLEPVPARDEHGVRWTSALVLVRVFTEPLGTVELPVGPEGIGAEALARAITAAWGPAVAERLRGAGAPWDGRVSPHGAVPEGVPPYVAGRRAALAGGPGLTAAVCTRDRPAPLARLLESLAAQRYDGLEVLVVDNAPRDDATRRAVDRLAGRLDVRYVVEPRPGLSWARNRAVAEASTDLIAWVDDDEECDPWWAQEIVRGFVEEPGAGAVTGMILPAEIETPAQRTFEDYGGHHKGRGFQARRFSPATRSEQSPLYPLPPFGTGGNMAFRREALDLIGGFDVAMGAGTATGGAEDTAALSLLLYRGGVVAYRPTAVVRHWHRRDDDGLRALFEAYGVGLGAFYASVLARHPGAILELLRLLPRALRDQTSPSGARLAGVAPDFPRELLRANRRGLLRGPARYAVARRRARRPWREGAGR